MDLITMKVDVGPLSEADKFICVKDEKTGTFPSRLELFVRVWVPKPNSEGDKVVSVGVLHLVHGYGEHSGMYRTFAEKMTAKGFIIVAHDHVGHGQSPGERVRIDRFSRYYETTEAIGRWIKATLLKELTQNNRVEWKISTKLNDIPLIVHGHSLGGLVVVKMLREICRKADEAKTEDLLYHCALLNGPCLGLTPELFTFTNRMKLKALPFVARMLPNFPIAKLDLDTLTRDPEVVQEIHNDELCYHGASTAGWFKLFWDELQEFLETPPSPLPYTSGPSFPSIISCHGDDDKICYYASSTTFIESQCSSQDKSVKVFKGSYHQIHRELPEVTDEFFKVISEWIFERI